MDISHDDRKVILHAKKTFLYDKNIPWTKKGDKNFDVGMGSFDGAETCEIVGLYLLHLLQQLTGLNLGLYRDDGLGVCSLRPRQVEQLKKKMCSLFRENNLSITTDVNHKVVNFLDVNFDLNSGIFRPFIKPNDKPIYINTGSNHPPSVIRNIPAAVNRRLSSISANEAVFKEAMPLYQEALETSGYAYKLEYNQPSSNTNQKRNRKRRITWFNPPWSSNVSTNIGGKFLMMIDDCFPPAVPLSKIINRNTVKVSYRCMPNMKQILSKHNAKVAKPQQDQQPPPGCNCRGGAANCPLDGACQTKGLIYEAEVTRGDYNTKEYYTGLTDRSFKVRYDEHNSDFRNQARKGTCLSKYVWKLKRENVPYSISWKIIARGRGFNPTTRSCQVCLKEKYLIMFRPEGATLNSRDEFFSTCRHRLKRLLSKTKT